MKPADGPVPRLRFPEFRDAGPWEVKRLGEVGTILKGKGISKSDIKPDGLLPCIRYGELYTIYGEVIRDVVSFTDADPDDLVLSNAGDVIIPASGETKEDIATASCVAGAGIALGGDLNILRSQTEGRFLAYYIRGNLKVAISKVAQGDSVVHLYPNQLEKLNLAVPTDQEQHKIADCLTSLDELIRAEGARLEALRDHKRGLMQRLFPRPGETTPRLRFPEFRDAGPWEVKRLGEVYRFKPTNSWPRDRLNYEAGTIRNIHYGDIHKGLRPSFRLPEEILPFLDEELADRLADDAYCEPGDVILADASEDLADIGKAIEIVEVDGERVVSGLHTILATPIERRLIVGFAAYLFASSAVRKQIQERAQGAKVLGLSKSQLSEVLLAYPRHEPEQHRIADCLASLDELIRAQGARLETLKAHKRGLMQQLFPQNAA